MEDGTRGRPPGDDPEATQIGAPPDGVAGETTDAFGIDDAATRLAGPRSADSRGFHETPYRDAQPSGRGSSAGGPRASHRSPGSSAAPRNTVGVRPRRRRARVNLPRLIVPIVFLAAVIALVTIAFNSGVIGGTGASKKPAAAATGKRQKSSASPSAVKVRKVYVVKAGDTLSAIAEKFKTTENELMIRNNLSTTTLRVGQRLKLPPPGQ
jgi:LysM repeat protein